MTRFYETSRYISRKQQVQIFLLNWALWYVPVFLDVWSEDNGSHYNLRLATFNTLTIVLAFGIPLILGFRPGVSWWAASLMAVSMYLLLGGLWLLIEWSESYRPPKQRG